MACHSQTNGWHVKCGNNYIFMKKCKTVGYLLASLVTPVSSHTEAAAWGTRPPCPGTGGWARTASRCSPAPGKTPCRGCGGYSGASWWSSSHCNEETWEGLSQELNWLGNPSKKKCGKFHTRVWPPNGRKYGKFSDFFFLKIFLKKHGLK